MSDFESPQRSRPIRRQPVIGGIVLGFVLAIVVQALLFTVLPYLNLEQTRQVALSVYWIPALVGIGLLLSRRTRQIGAGLMLGLSVGTMLAAGGCTVIDKVALGDAS